MPTNTAGSAARQLSVQAVHYLRKTVFFNDPGIASGVPFANPLPAGAEILRTTVKVKQAFNAGTTNVLTVGTAGGSNVDIVSASDVNEAAVASTNVLTGAGLTFASDTPVFVQYTQTGTAATAGRAVVIIEYVVDNDQ